MKKAIHGFVLKTSREIPEIRATAHIYEHEKTGAELMYLATDDTNKVFCATFMTLPEDSTGCPHILEHSVLNGSKNYPAKSTFNELLKASMHTFINAMTASDMTLYPVASTNDKDFINLMRVYLDAVFFPNIYKEPEILQQEGWHYELESPDGELGIRGVVYNEMKGAFSSPDRVVNRLNQQVQFPDTPYAYESGGDPEVIPELSYDKFLDFHRKYYHPTNCKIMLYGDVDIEQALQIIDGEYLGSFSKASKLPPAAMQKPFSQPLDLTLSYPIDEGQDADNSYYLCLNYTWGKVTDHIESMTTAMLADLLLNSPAAPMKQSILASGLAGDAYCSVNNDLLQPTLSLVFKNVHKDNLDKLNELVEAELTKLVIDGIDKRFIEASISHKEFYLREAQMGFPKGLFYHWASASSWIHGGDPLDVISFEEMLKELKRGLDEPFFEDHIKRVMLDNPHSSKVVFVPDSGMIKAQETALKDKLAKIKSEMSEDQIADIIKQTRELQAYQDKPDSPDDIAKIPFLSINDLNREAEKLPLEVVSEGDYELLLHPVTSNGIAYLKAYFDLSHATETDLPWLQLYVYLLGEVDSENYSFSELSNEIDIHTGGVNLGLSMLCDYNDPDIIHRNYVLSGKAVTDKLERMLELMLEYGLRPSFADTERIKSLIRMYKVRVQGYVLRNGVSIAITRMLKPFSQLHRWMDLTNGLEFFHFLEDLEKHIDSRMPELLKNMQAIKSGYFNRKNIKISITADEAIIPEIRALIPSFVSKTQLLDLESVEEHFHSKEINEAITAPVKIQFVAKGGNFFRKGYPYTGKLRVLANILRNEYLHREIRVKGGAYGFMCSFSTAGFQYFVSYMDPNLKETLDVYDTVADYLRSVDFDHREMEKFIIGEISSLDYPLTPERKGSLSDEDYITGFSQEDKQQIRDEVLATKIEDIRAFATMIEDLMSKNHYAVFGNEHKIKDNSELFDLVTPVFKSE